MANGSWRRGDRVILEELAEAWSSPLLPGMAGAVDMVDSLGTIHVRWDDFPGPDGKVIAGRRYGVDLAAGDVIRRPPLWALSVRQPWAAGIVHLGKTPENRTRRLPDRHVGEVIAIHAGLTVEFPDHWPPADGWASLLDGEDERRAWHAAWLARRARLAPRAHWPARLALGAVVGTARITGCHLCDPDELCGHSGDWDTLGGMCSRWAQPDCWHWELADGHALATPVPCPGSRGFWVLAGAADRAVQAQDRRRAA